MAQRDDPTRPLFMISIAAELAAMHPQTLRLYERRGLVQPRRSAKNTRLYSLADVDRLQRIQELTELGLNLAGVERVLALEAQVATMRAQMARLEERTGARGRRAARRGAAGRALDAPRPRAGEPHGDRARGQAPPLGAHAPCRRCRRGAASLPGGAPTTSFRRHKGRRHGRDASSQNGRARRSRRPRAWSAAAPATCSAPSTC